MQLALDTAAPVGHLEPRYDLPPLQPWRRRGDIQEVREYHSGLPWFTKEGDLEQFTEGSTSLPTVHTSVVSQDSWTLEVKLSLAWTPLTSFNESDFF